MKIVSREAWGAVHDDGAGPAPLPAREVWAHHSVTLAPDLAFTDLNADSTDDDEARAMRTLERIGQDRFGRGISYTFAIPPSGRVYEGHSVGRRGAHTAKRNSIARAVVFIGDYSTTPLTDAQVRSARLLLVHGVAQGWWLQPRFTGGHRQAPGAKTSCPGDAGMAGVALINSPAGPEPVTAWEDPTMPRLWLDPRDQRTQWAVTAHTMTRLADMAEVQRLQRLALLPPGRPEKVSADDFTLQQAVVSRVQDQAHAGLVTVESWSTASQTLELVVADTADLRQRVEMLEQPAAPPAPDPRVDELATQTADLGARVDRLEAGAA